MNPILLEFPHEFETERLLIRMPKPRDGEAVHNALKASIKELKPWMPFAQNNQSEEETEINVRESHINFLKREDLRLLVFHKETGQLVCSSGLHRIDWDVPKFEIGYWADTRFSGRGYTTEAVAGITQFAFKELSAKRVEIRCDSNNSKSKAIPERLGFRLEGVLRNDDLSVDGTELTDTCIYSKIEL
ncbi:GNAT family N-acetyltransferase [Halobacillus shinanisalinarum]|uniref:GNAT family N-acetyltransferase n=1 Tax=Halobacillus shinanisalinarum TaxID=2932258 RepID=A0ABY4H3W2_9BACI|nr:GNAT family N-acetyltransferase [Halobacillus shinanisalinarum]UOQ95014.1 GNAT family N-acetyltransferase [Halobacillus shinanisalinarum]